MYMNDFLYNEPYKLGISKKKNEAYFGCLDVNFAYESIYVNSDK